MTQSQLAVFKGKQISRRLYRNEWWFSVVDVCWTLTDSPDAGILAEIEARTQRGGK